MTRINANTVFLGTLLMGATVLGFVWSKVGPPSVAPQVGATAGTETAASAIRGFSASSGDTTLIGASSVAPHFGAAARKVDFTAGIRGSSTRSGDLTKANQKDVESDTTGTKLTAKSPSFPLEKQKDVGNGTIVHRDTQDASAADTSAKVLRSLVAKTDAVNPDAFTKLSVGPNEAEQSLAVISDQDTEEAPQRVLQEENPYQPRIREENLKQFELGYYISQVTAAVVALGMVFGCCRGRRARSDDKPPLHKMLHIVCCYCSGAVAFGCICTTFKHWFKVSCAEPSGGDELSEQVVDMITNVHEAFTNVRAARIAHKENEDVKGENEKSLPKPTIPAVPHPPAWVSTAYGTAALVFWFRM